MLIINKYQFWRTGDTSVAAAAQLCRPNSNRLANINAIADAVTDAVDAAANEVVDETVCEAV